MATHLRTTLVLAALDMAIVQRQPQAVIHHSDQGTQYTALAFGARCRAANVRPSMGSVGDCFDNAMAESFFATLECELLDRTSFPTPAAAQPAVFEFIEGWYNTRRRHSALGYVAPLVFEQQHQAIVARCGRRRACGRPAGAHKSLRPRAPRVPHSAHTDHCRYGMS